MVGRYHNLLFCDQLFFLFHVELVDFTICHVYVVIVGVFTNYQLDCCGITVVHPCLLVLNSELIFGLECQIFTCCTFCINIATVLKKNTVCIKDLLFPKFWKPVAVPYHAYIYTFVFFTTE